MDAVSAANHRFELQRQAFIYADIKTELLESVRSKPQMYVFREEGEDYHYCEILTEVEPIYDDKMTSSFKVGDNFQCMLRENSKELWFQITQGRNFINLRDPDKYIKREVDGVDYYVFVKMTGLSIVMVTPEVVGLDKARKLLKKMSKSIIKYDVHGNTVIKKGVR
jgi:hypothetical protein